MQPAKLVTRHLVIDVFDRDPLASAERVTILRVVETEFQKSVAVPWGYGPVKMTITGVCVDAEGGAEADGATSANLFAVEAGKRGPARSADGPGVHADRDHAAPEGVVAEAVTVGPARAESDRGHAQAEQGRAARRVGNKHR